MKITPGYVYNKKGKIEKEIKELKVSGDYGLYW
jgi:hypothetical protein